VARISYLMILEKRLPVSKDIIYATALLHDLGRADQYEKGISHEEAGAILAEEILTDCGIPSAAGRIKSGKKRSPKSRSRRSVKNGKDSGRNTADRMRSGTDSEKNGKNNGKNSVRHRRRRTVLEIRPVSGHPERLRLWR